MTPAAQPRKGALCELGETATGNQGSRPPPTWDLLLGGIVSMIRGGLVPAAIIARALDIRLIECPLMAAAVGSLGAATLSRQRMRAVRGQVFLAGGEGRSDIKRLTGAQLQRHKHPLTLTWS
jgi:hypothetical protein